MRLPLQIRLALLASLIVAPLATRARGQEPSLRQVDPFSVNQSLERRVQELEETIRRMQSERPSASSDSRPLLKTLPSGAGAVEIAIDEETKTEQLPAAIGSTGIKSPSMDSSDKNAAIDGEQKPAAVAGWDDGFFLRSDDRRFNLRITGQIQADYRTFLDDVDFVDVDTFFLRRARLGIEATLLDYYEFRLLPDFVPNQPRIQDAYLNIHYWDAFQLEVGKFKQPFSYEQLIQDRFVPTLERSMIDQLVPGRDVGVMIHGQHLLCNRLEYGISVSNGGINADSDTNDRKDLAGRIAVRPFNCECFWPVLHGLQIGISGSTGIEEEPANPSTLRTPAGVPWFQFNPTVRADGLRNRWSPEVAYFLYSFGMAAQYLEENQRFRPAFSGPSSNIVEKVPFDGFYVLASYLLTGEERTTYSQAVTPIRNFNPWYPLSCPGAWEILVRVSRLNIDDKVFAPGLARLADPTRFAGGATELTVGFNWYLNRWVRTQFNWEHAWFDKDVLLGPGAAGLLDRQDTLMTRLQIIF
jgi:phosphate-selective porin OprO/OprP